MDIDLFLGLEALLNVFVGYLMSRYTAHYSSAGHNQLGYMNALDVSGVALVTAAILSAVSAVVGYDRQAYGRERLIAALMTSFLPALGVFTAASGCSIYIAGLVALFMFAVNAAVRARLVGNASLLGAIAGSIAIGYKFGKRRIGFGIILGTVIGFIVATLVAMVLLVFLSLFLEIGSSVSGSVLGFQYNVAYNQDFVTHYNLNRSPLTSRPQHIPG